MSRNQQSPVSTSRRSGTWISSSRRCTHWVTRGSRKPRAKKTNLPLFTVKFLTHTGYSSSKEHLTLNLRSAIAWTFPDELLHRGKRESPAHIHILPRGMCLAPDLKGIEYVHFEPAGKLPWRRHFSSLLLSST